MDRGMIICPYCDSENIAGADSCDHCGQPLSDLQLPTPATHVESCLLRDRLEKVPLQKPVTTVAPNTPLGEVLKLMASRSIGCVLITDEERLVGIFSERDVVNRVNVRAAELSDHPVSEFMTRDPQSLEVDAKVAFALHRMGIGHYRHVPIVDNQSRPTAIISVRDILNYLTDRLAEA